jgi:hypothetical protein
MILHNNNNNNHYYYYYYDYYVHHFMSIYTFDSMLLVAKVLLSKTEKKGKIKTPLKRTKNLLVFGAANVILSWYSIAFDKESSFSSWTRI